MYKREKIIELGGYNVRLRRSEDYDLWFRCAKAGMKFYNIPEPLILYRYDDVNLNKQTVNSAIEKSLTGFRGASRAGMPMWKRMACFYILAKALIPRRIRGIVCVFFGKADPRKGYVG